MKSKKAVMGFAALLIFVFHFYIPFTDAGAETFFYRSAYVGVDLFFFLSAVSLGKNEVLPFRGFILNRLSRIYLPFAGLALIAAVYKSWTVKKLIFVLLGIDFLQKGGGAFLWFLPGIMLLYLITPLIIKLKSRLGLKSLWLLLILWGAAVVMLQYALNWTRIFILLNRIPIYLLGLYFTLLNRHQPRKLRVPMIIAGLIIGGALVWHFGTTARLNVPIKEMYYILAIPYTLSLAALFELAAEKFSLSFAPLAFLGSLTLELYGLQMIFGYDIESFLVSRSVSGQLAFIITASVLIAASRLLSILRKSIYEYMKRRTDV